MVKRERAAARMGWGRIFGGDVGGLVGDLQSGWRFGADCRVGEESEGLLYSR